MHLKPLPKFLLLATVVGGSLFAYRHLVTTGKIHRPSILKTVIPLKVDELSASVLTGSSVPIKPLPSASPLQTCADGNTKNCLSGASQEVEMWAWNANMGLLEGVGGLQTTKGSLAALHGAAVTIRRQDDTGQMQNDLLDCAQRLLNGPNVSCTKFVTIMGDGGAQFFRAINPKLAKICSDCTVKTIAVLGYSRGEDGFWGPAEWKSNPEKAKGGVVVGVLRDGDWNIARKPGRQYPGIWTRRRTVTVRGHIYHIRQDRRSAISAFSAGLSSGQRHPGYFICFGITRLITREQRRAGRKVRS